ncbi:histidine phosphatase family protein [Paenibacillus thiaminolyticus]|uniref:histidine phosphatase family protein n=1 Tax=Paenibacillus thiaminolyticus TaxID=49283 RepID=UPI00287315D2|nr:histidine phosphatase family protein [Paenibacillus thiaminolyticus]
MEGCSLAKTTLYLTRHGQAEWNVEERMQGHKDSPLTSLGVLQAEWLSFFQPPGLVSANRLRRNL